MKKRIRNGMAALLALSLPLCAFSQASSINTYSPSTIYGIGDMFPQGTSLLRSMGSIGSGFKSPIAINYMNPASYSALRPNSFLLDFGMSGKNSYLSNGVTKTSNNTFNISNFSIAMPLARNMGLGITVSPYSSVGYYIEEIENDPDIVANLGQVRYVYTGEGGISEAKTGVGFKLFKHFSLGAEVIYLFGTISKVSAEVITPITSGVPENGAAISYTESYSKLSGALAFQYDIIANDKRVLTLGGKYQLSSKLNPKCTRFIPSNNMYGDTVKISSSRSDFTLPSTITAGFYYQTPKFGAGIDYSLQQWKGSNTNTDAMTYRNTNSINAGLQYTPNFGDIRHFMRRITYRAGVKYSDYYLNIKGEQLSDKAITFGVGFPLKMTGLSNINLGAEFGTRGTTRGNMVKENYFRVTIGLSLFGEDYWFMKHKFD